MSIITSNTIVNEKKAAQKQEEEDHKVKSSEDKSDLVRKFNKDKVSGYNLLLDEFVPVEGEGVGLKKHMIQSGDHKGKMNYKQEWSKFVLA